MRTLPRNISAHPGGLLVRVIRGRIKYQAYVAFGKVGQASSLSRAIDLRDRFLRLHGATVNRHQVKGKSSTGIAGISETTQWRRSRPYAAFSVSWYRHGRQNARRILFGAHRPRAVAFAQAKALRARMAGIDLNSVGQSCRSAQINPQCT